MTNALLVGLGGFLGSVGRYLVGGWAMQASGAGRFPAGTFTVNLLGCLAIGVLAGLAERLDLFGPGARLFLFTGLLGGFTTFSAFGVESFQLLRRGDPWMAAVYVGLRVVLGIVAVWAGYRGMAAIPRLD